MKKVFKVIKTIIIAVLAVLFFAFVIAMTLLLLNFNKYGLTQFGNTTLVIIDSKLSSNDFKKGDLVLVDSKKIDNVSVGDNVFAYKVDSSGAVSIDLGKVGEVHTADNAVEYANGSTYSMDYVIGEASKIYPNIGSYLSIIESKWGFLFIILVPSFLIFVYEFYALIVEIKYGKEEF